MLKIKLQLIIIINFMEVGKYESIFKKNLEIFE